MQTAPNAPSWRLELLGGTALQGPGGLRVKLDLRPAALLALLALEGPQPRARLAALLWPDSPEATARNNLRQLLRRLRQATGEEAGEVVEDVDGQLRLSPQVQADAAQLELHASAGRYADIARQEGELLWGHAYDALPELGDWVHAQREHLRALRAGALEQEAARLERAGTAHAALEWNARLLELAPASEAAHRRSMRLHALLGDRGAALRAYDRCRLALQRELDLEPSAETRALARDIERGAGAPSAAPAAPRAPRCPPPSCVRRCSRGARGCGRSSTRRGRRARACSSTASPARARRACSPEFLASRGEDTLLVPGRPGDCARALLHLRAPVAAAARAQARGRPCPRGRAASSAAWCRSWARRPRAQGETDKMRLFESLVELMRHTAEGLGAIVTDDLQYIDTSSMETAGYLLARQAEGLELPRFMTGIRAHELGARDGGADRSAWWTRGSRCACTWSRSRARR